MDKLPLAAVSLLFGIVTLAIQMGGPAMPSLASLPLLQRLETAVVSCAAYLRKAAWTTNLTPVYYLLPDGGYAWWQAGGSSLLIASLLLLAMHRQRSHS